MTHRLNFMGNHFNANGSCACTNDCCTTEYCICPDCNQTVCAAEHPPEEPVAKLPTPVIFQPGDKVQPRSTRAGAQYNAGPYRSRTVKFVGETIVVYDYEKEPGGATSEQSTTLKHFIESFEQVPKFFQAGRSYKRFAEWSIAAQRSEVIERFEVKQVERNGTGLHIAFGRLVVVQHADQWVLRDEFSWDNGRWEEDR